MNQNLYRLILLSVLLKLMLIPFFMHMDLLSEFRRVHWSVENLEFYPGFNRLVIFWIECLFYSVTQWFVVDGEFLLHLEELRSSTASIPTHFIFVGEPSVFRHLFIFKLPYLVFDYLTAFYVWKFFSGHRWQKIALLLWVFNPVIIYSAYIFGRFDTISLFFIVWTAWFLKSEKGFLAAIAFGLALNCREINILLLPAFIVSSYFLFQGNRAIVKSIMLTSVCALFYIMPYAIGWIVGSDGLYTSEGNILEVKKAKDIFFGTPEYGVFPFVVIYCLSFWFVATASGSAAEKFVKLGLVAFASTFLMGFKGAAYFSWIVPFLVLVICYKKETLLPALLLIATWFAYWLVDSHGAHFTLLLATPIYEAFFSSRTFHEYLIREVIPANTLSIPQLRMLLFSIASSLLIIYMLILSKGQRND